MDLVYATKHRARGQSFDENSMFQPRPNLLDCTSPTGLHSLWVDAFVSNLQNLVERLALKVRVVR